MMPKRILFCATVDAHFKSFHLPYMEWFAAQDWEVHVAANGSLDLPFVHRKFQIPLRRSPFHLDNMKAYQALKSIIADNHYAIIHCHTPLGGVVARLAARKARKIGTKVIYTAHGFHFCQGSSIRAWMMYYPIEKGLARLTDCLITINEEDYVMAITKQFPAKRIEWVHGVGVNTEVFTPAARTVRDQSRQSSGYSADDFLMFYAAEFNRNKNHQLLIRALAVAAQTAPAVRLLLAGDGPLLEQCRTLAQRLGAGNNVHFLGYRNDVAKLLPMCDIAVTSSLREGLPVNIMEAMACGLPVVATPNRGHQELIEEGINGFIVLSSDHALFAQRMLELYRSAELCRKMGQASMERVNRFSIAKVGVELQTIYAMYGSDAHVAQGQHLDTYI